MSGPSSHLDHSVATVERSRRLQQSPISTTPANFVATYHYVREKNSDGVTGITPAMLDEQLRALKKSYRLVTVDEFVRLSGTTQGIALITFDDAVRDQYAAAEVLAAHDAPAVFYAPMRPYGDSEDRWCKQHLLHALAEHLGWAELERRVDPYLTGVRINEEEMNRLYHYEVPHKRWLKYALAFVLPAEKTAEILLKINANVGLRAEDWFMSVEQLRALQDGGHALGGHGYDHVAYSTLSPHDQAADMRRAVETMNRLFGKRPRTMAYPFGRYTSETEAIARACGYTHAFTTDDRLDAKYVLEEIARRCAGAK